jgi:tetrahydromethanopterin S-methyltransferase subunit B
MRKIKIFLTTLAVAGVLFATSSCVDNTESESIKTLREAKAQQLIAKGKYDEALGEAAKVNAQALLVLNTAQAAVANANAKLIEASAAELAAKTELQKIENEIKKLESEYEAGILSEKIATQIAKLKSEQAKWAADLAEEEARKLEATLELERIRIDFENQAVLLQITLTKNKVALQDELWKLRYALTTVGQDRAIQSVLEPIVNEYTAALKQISFYEGEILAKEYAIQRKEIIVALDAYDKPAAIAAIIEDWENAIADNSELIKAKQESIEYWKSFKVDVDAIEAETQLLLKSVNDTLIPNLIAAKGVFNAASDASGKADTKYTEFFRDSINKYWYSHWDFSAAKWVSDSAKDYTSIYTGNTVPLYDHLTWTLSERIAQAEVVAALVKKDRDRVEVEVEDVEKMLEDTVKYLNDEVGAILIKARADLEAATAAWINAVMAYYTPSLGTPAVLRAKDSVMLRADNAYWETYAHYYGHGSAFQYATGVIDSVFDPVAKKKIEVVNPATDDMLSAYATSSPVLDTDSDFFQDWIRINGGLSNSIYGINVGTIFAAYGMVPSYAVWGWGLHEEYDRMDLVIKALNLKTRNGLIELDSRLTGINFLISVLKSGRLDVLLANKTTANTAKTNAYRGVSSVIGTINGIYAKISKLGEVVLGYGKTWNPEKGVYEDTQVDGYSPTVGNAGSPNTSNPQKDVITAAIIQGYIDTFEDEIEVLAEKVAVNQGKLDDATRHIDAVKEAFGAYYYYYLAASPAAISFNEAIITEAKRELDGLKKELADLEAEKAKWQATADALEAQYNSALAELEALKED